MLKLYTEHIFRWIKFFRYTRWFLISRSTVVFFDFLTIHSAQVHTRCSRIWMECCGWLFLSSIILKKTRRHVVAMHSNRTYRRIAIALNGVGCFWCLSATKNKVLVLYQTKNNYIKYKMFKTYRNTYSDLVIVKFRWKYRPKIKPAAVAPSQKLC